MENLIIFWEIFHQQNLPFEPMVKIIFFGLFMGNISVPGSIQNRTSTTFEDFIILH